MQPQIFLRYGLGMYLYQAVSKPFRASWTPSNLNLTLVATGYAEDVTQASPDMRHRPLVHLIRPVFYVARVTSQAGAALFLRGLYTSSPRARTRCSTNQYIYAQNRFIFSYSEDEQQSMIA